MSALSKHLEQSVLQLAENQHKLVMKLIERASVKFDARLQNCHHHF